jgi:hypothetical protein
VGSEHRRNRSACYPTFTVAGMKHAGPGNKPPLAILADMSVAEEKGVRAQQAIVVQGLDDRHSFSFGRIVTRRGNEGERVAKVGYPRLLSANNASFFTVVIVLDALFDRP